MLKLNVGLSRKVGEANFSSRGASVNLELEVESALAGDPDRLRDKIRHLFHLAKASVDEELNGNTHQGETNSNNGHRSQNGGRANGHGNGNGDRAATQSQVRALHAIARRQNVDLTNLVQQRFGCQRPEELSLRNASSLIDELNGAANGSRR